MSSRVRRKPGDWWSSDHARSACAVPLGSEPLERKLKRQRKATQAKRAVEAAATEAATQAKAEAAAAEAAAQEAAVAAAAVGAAVGAVSTAVFAAVTVAEHSTESDAGCPRDPVPLPQPDFGQELDRSSGPTHA